MDFSKHLVIFLTQNLYDFHILLFPRKEKAVSPTILPLQATKYYEYTWKGRLHWNIKDIPKRNVETWVAFQNNVTKCY